MFWKDVSDIYDNDQFIKEDYDSVEMARVRDMNPDETKEKETKTQDNH